ncbi:MAG TPA: hypothetical protein VEZ71_08040 [Archangium sp.]|nr:hypothetical protein [Archangium sp.]
MSPARPATASLVVLLVFMQACGGSVGPGDEGYFATLPPGSQLPSGAECAGRVRRSSWEPRPGNATANQTRGKPGVRIDGASDEFNARFSGKIDGDFTGTTDEILQWGACKWGLDEDIVRAVAVVESRWRQDEVGEDFSTFGIMQIRSSVHANTYPYTRDSTAYGIDYALAWRRACYEGDFTWMNSLYKQGGYAKGDEWGCVGAWFSGDWYDGDENVTYSGAKPYIKLVKQRLAERTWTRADFRD